MCGGLPAGRVSDVGSSCLRISVQASGHVCGSHDEEVAGECARRSLHANIVPPFRAARVRARAVCRAP